jgi:hypothetical protein
MNATMKCFRAGAASALVGIAMASSAEANYLGYANGDPANWGLYQEQHNGTSPPSEAAAAAPTPHHPNYLGGPRSRIEYQGRTYPRHPARRAPSEY